LCACVATTSTGTRVYHILRASIVPLRGRLRDTKVENSTSPAPHLRFGHCGAHDPLTQVPAGGAV
jgi:hypothetical protein